MKTATEFVLSHGFHAAVDAYCALPPGKLQSRFAFEMRDVMESSFIVANFGKANLLRIVRRGIPPLCTHMDCGLDGKPKYLSESRDDVSKSWRVGQIQYAASICGVFK